MPTLEILQGCRNKHSRLSLGGRGQQTHSTPQVPRTRESIAAGTEIKNVPQNTQVPNNNNSRTVPTQSNLGPFDIFFDNNKELVVISAVGLLLVLIL